MEAPKDVFLHVLLALAAVILLGRALGIVFVRLRQPPVIAEVLAGILLGPSLLGQVVPEVADYLLPASVGPFLGVIAQLGIVLYMFLVGLELNVGVLRRRARSALIISQASIAAPFALGAALAVWLHPRFTEGDVPLSSFSLFMGVAMAVTAFPVLARILTDRGISRTEIGVLAMACAAINDVTAWCLLAFVVGVARSEVAGSLFIALFTAAFIACMFLVVRPVATRLARRYDDARRIPVWVVAMVFVAVLASAAATERIGIHAIFGAFLLGVVIPFDCALARSLPHKLEELVTILFLPAFFALTGMRTQIGLVSGVDEWLICGAITLTATVGKIGGTTLAARLAGEDWPTATGLGVLMNTRGLMELIVLNVGLELGIISPRLFAMMVLMALVTTMATAPLWEALVWLGLRRPELPTHAEPAAKS